MIVNFNSSYKIFIVSVIIITLFYLPVYYLSFIKVVNFWSFSQAHLDYSQGFIRRGLFGELLNFFSYWNLDRRLVFSIFFILFNTINIILFCKLLKKYYKSLVFFFLLFHPALILFSFNDLGGYQRFEIFGIFLILLHSFYVNLAHKKKIFQKYYNIFFTANSFLIFLSLIMHEINFFLILFHFLIFLQYKEATIKNIIISIFYLFFFSTITILLTNTGLDKDGVDYFINVFKNNKLWIEPIIHIINPLNFSNNENKVLINSIFNLRNLLTLSFLFLFSSFTIIFFILFLKKDRKIFVNKYCLILLILINLIFVFFSVYIGDNGRWINLASIGSFSYLCSLKISNLEQNIHIKKHVLISLILLIINFTIKIPHTGYYSEKNISIFKGMYFKIYSIYKATLSPNKKFFDINKRFKN